MKLRVLSRARETIDENQEKVNRNVETSSDGRTHDKNVLVGSLLGGRVKISHLDSKNRRCHDKTSQTKGAMNRCLYVVTWVVASQ